MQMLRFHPFSSLPRGLNEMTHSLCKNRRRLVWGLKRCRLVPAAKRGNLFGSHTKIVTLSSPASYFCLLLNLCSVLNQSLLKDLLVGVHQTRLETDSEVSTDKLLLPCLPHPFFTALSFPLAAMNILTNLNILWMLTHLNKTSRDSHKVVSRWRDAPSSSISTSQV